MRPPLAPDADQLQATINRFEEIGTPIGHFAADLLLKRSRAGRIGARTFAVYKAELESLVDWSTSQGFQFGTPAADAACEAWVQGAPMASVQRRLRATLMVELRGEEPVRRKDALAVWCLARADADLTNLPLDQLKHVHRRAVDLISRIGKDGTASECLLLRAALLAFCRYGAARPSDLAALTLGDLPSQGAARWTSARSRRADGRVRTEGVTLPFPAEVRGPVERYLAFRATHQCGVHESAALVFRRPDGGDPLLRNEIHKIIAGLYAGSKVSDEGAKALDASDRRRYGERCILDQPLSAGAESFDRLSPSLLWHCCAIDVVSRHGTYSDADLKVVGAALGCHVRRATARYRGWLERDGWRADQPYRVPKERAATAALRSTGVAA